MTILIYAASLAVLLWAFWPMIARKWREYRFTWTTVQDTRPRWHDAQGDEGQMPMNCRCWHYGPLGESNVDFGRDTKSTGPR